MFDADTDAQFQAEYSALTTGRGCVPLEGWSSIGLTGSDRATFLNSFCTNDVMPFQPGDACEAFITDVKGKILGHVLVTCREDQLVLVTLEGQAQGIIEHLDRYLIREDVALHDTSGELDFALVTGVAPVEIRSRTDQPCFPCSWLTPIESVVVQGRLSEAAQRELGVIECGRPAFEAVRVEAGLPLYGTDFDSGNLPQEIGRDRRAISFTKGCYLGQETVARIDALGHVNQQLVGACFQTPGKPLANSELTRDDKVVGEVKSVAWSPKLGAFLGLAMVRRAALAPGTRLASAAGECEVVALPVTQQPGA